MTKFDLVIIGGGPGGYPLALRQARKGWKVALVEADEVGGTCLHRGCIPTKALLASAKGLHFLKNAWQLGLSAENAGFSWEKVQTRKRQMVDQMQASIGKHLQNAGVQVIRGKGILSTKNLVTVIGKDASDITAPKICLAVGSVPGVPASFLHDPNLVWTSDQALTATEIPATLLVIGAGVIGLEMGQIFTSFGTKVTVVEMMPQILSGLDSATAKRLMPVFKKAGLEILLDRKVDDLKIEGSQISVHIGGERRTFHRALIAIGRRPNLGFLEKSDLKLAFDGPAIAVNDRYETSEPGVYALGDAIRGPMLAHKATYDAEILARQWDGRQIVPDYSSVPSCVYTFPEIAWVGLSEEEARRRGLSFQAGKSLFSSNGRALALGETEGQVKTLVGPDGKLIGAVVWGPEASNLIMEPTLLHALGIPADRFETVIHPHPTLSEIFLDAFENALGRNLHG